jgi:hypothetical protein
MTKQTKTKGLTVAQVEQRRSAATSHGARSEVALAPRVISMKKGLLARMGLRQRDLSWAGRELLDSYCRGKAKVVAIDGWLEDHALIDDEGNSPNVMKLYFVALNATTRNLEALRGVIADLAREDERFDGALAALVAEGSRIRAKREAEEGTS